MLGALLKSIPKVIEKAEKGEVAGAIGAVEEQVVEHVTKKRKVARNIHQAVRAPLLFSQGAKVQAAQNLTNAVRFDATEPMFRAVDEVLKTSPKATAADRAGVKVLKHRTSTEAGDSIAVSRQMRPGKEGVLGAGIYFAEDEQATEVKAVNGTQKDEAYAIVTAKVDLGNCRRVKTGEREWRMICDGGFDKDVLQELDYHSVGSYFNGGWEYCVFDPSRVTVLEVVHHRPANCGVSSNRRKRPR